MRILCSIVFLWAIGTVISTHVGAEPYPAIAFPGFGLKSTNSIIYTKFYKVDDGYSDEILFDDTPMKAVQFRRFVMAYIVTCSKMIRNDSKVKRTFSWDFVTLKVEISFK